MQRLWDGSHEICMRYLCDTGDGLGISYQGSSHAGIPGTSHEPFVFAWYIGPQFPSKVLETLGEHFLSGCGVHHHWSSLSTGRSHFAPQVNPQINLDNFSFILSSVPGRIATLSLFVSLMFIYVSYSANIVALLQTSSNSIRTLEDLLKSRIPIGVDDTIFNHFFFTVSNTQIREQSKYAHSIGYSDYSRANKKSVVREKGGASRKTPQLFTHRRRREENEAGTVCVPHGNRSWI